MDQNLFALFRSRFPGERSQPLLTDESGRSLTYAQAERRVAQLAGALAAAGARPGDRITVQTEKSPDQLLLYLACLAGGFVFQPLNTAYTSAELAYFLSDCSPAIVIGRPETEPLLQPLAREAGVGRLLTMSADGSGSLIEAAAAAEPLQSPVERGGEDLAAILYSSGTTGKPKGAMLTHGNLASNAAALVQAWGFGPQDRLLHALPLFHAHGLFVAVSCALLAGAWMRFLLRFDAEAVIRHLPEATVFMGVPTYYTRLLAEPEFGPGCCRAVRLFVSGSAPLLPETFARFEARSGHSILERYGMTETLMNSSNPLHGKRVPGSVGLPLPGIGLRIAGKDDHPLPDDEVGEIQVKGPNVFSGYWGNPEKTAESFSTDGWFRTGDLGRRDRHGYYFIVGRAKDLIISGGLNLYPKEIEDCIDALPGVLESAVVGIPHPDFGEVAAAAVVPEPGSRLEEAAVIAQLKGVLASFKLPKRVRFVAELPRNAMGKVEKARLRALLARD